MFSLIRFGFTSLVAANIVVGCANVANGYDLRSALETAAPDFNLGWEIAFSNVRTERDLHPLVSRYDLFPDFEDSFRLSTDFLDYLIESGQPVPQQATDLAGYSVDPDSYVMNEIRSEDLADTSVLKQNVGCSIGTRPEATLNETSRQLVMTRSCRLTRDFHGRSEQEAVAVYQSWQDQSVALGRLLGSQNLPEGWGVTFFANGNVTSATPITPFYKMEFAPSDWQRTDSPVIGSGGDVLQGLKIETSPPRFSDVYGTWAVTVYVSVELDSVLSQREATMLHNGSFFQ